MGSSSGVEHQNIMMNYVIICLFISSVAPSPQFGFIGDFVNGLLGNNNRRPNSSSSGRNEGCGGRNQPNHRFGGKDYLVSWRLGCTSFTQSGAESFCRKSNMRPISIDSSVEEREFLGLVGRENQKYFWTGGKLSGRGSSIQWPSGRRYNSVNWSRTGGANKPQPDNREGNEFCLAVLNNFYNDGIVFHDVSCHHAKPTICEA